MDLWLFVKTFHKHTQIFITLYYYLVIFFIEIVERIAAQMRKGFLYKELEVQKSERLLAIKQSYLVTQNYFKQHINYKILNLILLCRYFFFICINSPQNLEIPYNLELTQFIFFYLTLNQLPKQKPQETKSPKPS